MTERDDDPQATRTQGGWQLIREAGTSEYRSETLVRRGASGPDHALAWVRSRMGNESSHRGDLDSALVRHQLTREMVGDDEDVAAAESHVDVASVCFDRGELRQAERHLREAMCRYRQMNDLRGVTVVRVNLAVLAIELGRPGEAEPVLREALAADEASGAASYLARDCQLLGLAALARGDLDEARVRLARARQLLRELRDEPGEAFVLHAQALLAIDADESDETIRAAETGLLVLAPRAPSRLSERLRIAAAWGRARHDAASARTDRLVRQAIDRGLATGDAAARAEALAVRAMTASAEHAANFDQAIDTAAGQERPDVLGRILVAARRCAGQDRDVARVQVLGARLLDLYQAPDRCRRLRLAGLPELRTASAPRESLADESLVRLEEALNGESPGTSLGSRLERSLAVLGSRVPFTRAAFLVADEAGLRVASAIRVARGGGESEALALALVLGERARLLGKCVVEHLRDGEGSFAEHPETTAWGLATALAIPTRAGAVLYLDRSETESPFLNEERAFARAVAERVAIGLAGTRAAIPAAESLEVARLREDDFGILGASPAVQRLRAEILLLARAEVPVFLSGESGTGKELAAIALHRASRRSRRPFLALNCAAMPEGLLESELFGSVRGAFSGATDRDGLLAEADGGILFLDEIGDLSAGFQAKLLRAVELGEVRPVGATETRHVDVRFICATHRDMARAMAEGRFREDLFYRLLATATIELPPLRKRPGDVTLLAARFAAREASRLQVDPLILTPAALAALERYSFPGNVRELERMVAGLVARASGRVVSVEDLPRTVNGQAETDSLGGNASLEVARRQAEHRYLSDLLVRHGGNRTHAARTARVARQTLISLLKRHGLERGIGAASEAIPSALRALV